MHLASGIKRLGPDQKTWTSFPGLSSLEFPGRRHPLVSFTHFVHRSPLHGKMFLLLTSSCSRFMAVCLVTQVLHQIHELLRPFGAWTGERCLRSR